MRTSLSVALLLGVVTFVTGPVSAQSASDVPSPMQGVARNNERGALRLQREFDFNKDGQVTRDEMNRTLGARFAAATHRGPTMTMEQFMGVRAEEFRQQNEKTFHSLDWNGDGKLSLTEYAAPQHTRFVTMDRAGAGYIFCAEGVGRAGIARFCTDNDVNLDGRVARQELDTAIAKRFSKATGGSQAMTMPQFLSSEQQRFEISNARYFRRLDTDGDGVLSIQEFAGTELKLFARLDKNKDGILSPTELHARLTRVSRNETD